MKKNIELSLKEAQELYGQNSVMDKMLIANFPKEELENTLPTDWVCLGAINGHYLNNDYGLSEAINCTTINRMKSVFASHKEAKSALAMAQLSQLMKVYRNGWEADWNDRSYKYCIEFYKGNVQVDDYFYQNHYLSFPTKELAKQFLENFRDLIEDYFMIEK